MRNDRGGVIVGYFTKIALTIGIFAIVCFDAVSVGVARVSVEDTAKGAAAAGAEAWNSSKNSGFALRAAADYAEDHGGQVDAKTFRIDADGTVTVSVTKQATTLLLYRTKKTEKWTQVEATGKHRAV